MARISKALYALGTLLLARLELMLHSLQDHTGAEVAILTNYNNVELYTKCWHAPGTITVSCLCCSSCRSAALQPTMQPHIPAHQLQCTTQCTGMRVICMNHLRSLHAQVSATYAALHRHGLAQCSTLRFAKSVVASKMYQHPSSAVLQGQANQHPTILSLCTDVGDALREQHRLSQACSHA
jgi:hypothetical protein